MTQTTAEVDYKACLEQTGFIKSPHTSKCYAAHRVLPPHIVLPQQESFTVNGILGEDSVQVVIPPMLPFAEIDDISPNIYSSDDKMEYNELAAQVAAGVGKAYKLPTLTENIWCSFVIQGETEEAVKEKLEEAIKAVSGFYNVGLQNISDLLAKAIGRPQDQKEKALEGILAMIEIIR